jgi:hypothetical protein
MLELLLHEHPEVKDRVVEGITHAYPRRARHEVEQLFKRDDLDGPQRWWAIFDTLLNMSGDLLREGKGLTAHGEHQETS